MPSFAYRARDARGQVVEGRMEGADERAVVRALRAQGLIVTGLEPARGPAPRPTRPGPGRAPRPAAVPPAGAAAAAGPGAAPPVAAAAAPGALTLDLDLGRLLGARRPKPIPLRELVVFCRQFASILEAGVPILTGFRVVAAETANRPFKAALAAIAGDLEAGRSLSEAIAARGPLFPPLFQHVLAAGEQGGFLEESFRRLAEQFEKEDQINQKIRSAMLYPKVIGVVAVLVVAAMLTFIVPNFVQVFEGMNAELPALTRGLLAVSGFLRTRWYLVPPALVAVVLGVRLYAARPSGRRRLDRLALRVPVFGPLAVRRALAVFSRTLGTLLKGGVPILQALALVEQTVGNTVLQEVIRAAADDVRQGRGMLDALRASPHFPRVFIEMLNVGEETGRTEEMLHRVAAFYEADVERTAERMTSLIEPFMIVFLGGIVAVILLSVFLPMFGMWSNLQQQQ